MADIDRPSGRHTWLLEQYEPGAPASLLHARLRELTTAAAREAAGVIVLASVVLPADEQALCLLESASANAIAQVCRDSRFRADRLVQVEPTTQS